TTTIAAARTPVRISADRGILRARCSAAPNPTPTSTAIARFNADENLYVVRNPAAPGTRWYADSNRRPNGVGEWTGNTPAVTNTPTTKRNKKNSRYLHRTS